MPAVDTPPATRREIVSWAFFDFANSSFTTVIITVVYALYFKGVVAPPPESITELYRGGPDLLLRTLANMSGEGGALMWSIALAVSNVAIILTAPALGAAADRRARKKKYLFASYLLCSLATAGLFFAGSGDLILALVLFVVANIAFASGENLVAGFLPELASTENMSRVSALGWGIGYIGGLAALALALPLAQWDGDAAQRDFALRAICLVTAGFFLLGGLPTFLFVRERAVDRGPPVVDAETGARGSTLTYSIQRAFNQIRDTWRARHRHPDLFRFLFALLFFSIGIYGVIGQAAVYAQSLFGLEQSAIIKIFMASQLAAAAGALISGRLGDQIGSLKTLAIMLCLWIFTGLVALFSSSVTAYWIIAMTAGFSMGATLSVARAVVGQLTPPGQNAETFGYWGQFGRLAGVLAPAGNALAIALTGSLRTGIAYFTLTFVIGLVLLGRVRLPSSAAKA